MSRELQIRLINVAQTHGRSLRNKRGDPVRTGIVQCLGAEGVDVHRDRSGHEAKIWSSKGTCDVARIPTVIEGAVRHRIRGGEDRWRIIVHHWNPNLVKLCGHLTEPLISSCEIGASLVCAIDISAPPQSALLRCYRIDNHALHCRGSRRVEPANEQ